MVSLQANYIEDIHIRQVTVEFSSTKIVLGLALAVCWPILGCTSAQERATEHLKEADRLAQLDRFDAAELELKEALDEDPGHFDALMGLATLELRQDRLEEAAVGQDVLEYVRTPH